METFKFQDIRVEKANSILRCHRRKRITNLFRFVEVFVFLIIISSFFTQFPFSFKSSGEYFRGISVTLISPQFVFVLGNVIIIILFLKSGQFSAKNGEKTPDFYHEYVEKCRKNQETCSKKGKTASDAYKYSVFSYERKIQRSHTENLEKAVVVHGEEHRHELRRSMTDKCRKSMDCQRQVAMAGGKSSSHAEGDMSGEEFRRTVEAFIARQQRFVREEEFSAVVSFEA